jgi:hypothetical protein
VHVKRSRVLLTAALLAGTACRSAAPPGQPAAPQGPSPAFITGYVGQGLVLRHYGTHQRVTLTRQEIGRLGGECDIGVNVREASFAGGTASFTLDALGPAVVPDQPPPARARGTCGTVPSFLVTVSGFVAEDTAETIQGELGGLLPTPEGYLAARGVSFDRPAGPDPKLAASQERNASFEERTLAGKVKAWPRPLLRVEPFYRDPSGRVRHEGEVEFASVVGEDGRLHSPKLRTPLESAHEQHVLRALALWRFEPAMADAPVAARIVNRFTLRVY